MAGNDGGTSSDEGVAAAGKKQQQLGELTVIEGLVVMGSLTMIGEAGSDWRG